jgi:polysaccharide biosynthesis/export protein
MLKNLRFKFRTIILFIIVFFTVSCVPLKKLTYINDIKELQSPYINPKEHKLISPFDKIYVKVYSIDEKTNLLFGSSETTSTTSTPGLIGYLVDEAGDISFPFAGKIHVAGLSTSEAAAKINESLNEYVPTASVVVRFIENSVSIIGEVFRQGTYNFTQDKITIYDALSLGGGMTQYAKRKGVVLVRQEGDKIMHHTLDLSDSKIAEKEYYYIQANDIIIVEPLRWASVQSFSNLYSLILSSVSLLLTIALTFQII